MLMEITIMPEQVMKKLKLFKTDAAPRADGLLCSTWKELAKKERKSSLTRSISWLETRGVAMDRKRAHAMWARF